MKISIDLDGIQEGKQYNLSFCLTSDGEVKMEKTSKTTTKKPKENKGPSLESFEEKQAPKLEDFKEKTKATEFKVESSMDGKMDAGGNM